MGFERLGIGGTQDERAIRIVQDPTTGFSWIVRKELIERGATKVTQWTCEPISEESSRKTKPRCLVFYPHTLGLATVKPEKAKNGLFARLEISPFLRGDKSPNIIWDQETGILIEGSSKKPLRERQKAFNKAAEDSFWPSDYSSSRRKVVAAAAAATALTALAVSSLACGEEGKTVVPAESVPTEVPEVVQPTEIPPSPTVLPSATDVPPEPVEQPILEPTAALDWPNNWLPEDIREAGMHDYQGRAKEIINEVESACGIKIVSPKKYFNADGIRYDNLSCSEDELRILKEGIEAVPVQFRELLAGGGIVVLKASNIEGGSPGAGWAFLNEAMFFFFPSDFDGQTEFKPPIYNFERMAKADLLHEFFHVYDSKNNIHQKWAERTGWTQNEDDSWSYDPIRGRWNDLFEIYKVTFLLDPREDIAFSIMLYYLEPGSLDDNRKALIKEFFLDKHIILPTYS